MSFGSANRISGELFTGSHHEIEIISRRFLQLRRLNDTTIESPDVQRVWNQLSGIEELERSHLDHGLKETDLLPEGRRCYSNGQFYNRQFFRNVYFDSLCFSRAPMQGDCNSFVSFSYHSEVCFGQIVYFVSIPESYNGKIIAVVKKYQTLEEVGTVKGFFFRVRETCEELFIDLESMKKVFRVRLPNLPASESMVVKLCSSFDHS